MTERALLVTGAFGLGLAFDALARSAMGRFVGGLVLVGLGLAALAWCLLEAGRREPQMGPLIDDEEAAQ